ncbi:Hypothetical protein POVN_LOCUS489 [uncultured virus]|nr:Hypothetical protein POVN_LOCUS489 [uncultured virus]
MLPLPVETPSPAEAAAATVEEEEKKKAAEEAAFIETLKTMAKHGYKIETETTDLEAIPLFYIYYAYDPLDDNAPLFQRNPSIELRVYCNILLAKPADPLASKAYHDPPAPSRIARTIIVKNLRPIWENLQKAKDEKGIDAIIAANFDAGIAANIQARLARFKRVVAANNVEYTPEQHLYIMARTALEFGYIEVAESVVPTGRRIITPGGGYSLWTYLTKAERKTSPIHFFFRNDRIPTGFMSHGEEGRELKRLNRTYHLLSRSKIRAYLRSTFPNCRMEEQVVIHLWSVLYHITKLFHELPETRVQAFVEALPVAAIEGTIWQQLNLKLLGLILGHMKELVDVMIRIDDLLYATLYNKFYDIGAYLHIARID